MDDIELTQIRRRLRRLELQNRILVAVLCLFAGIASIGVTRAASSAARDIRAHRFSLVDPNGIVVNSWYSDEAGSWHGP
jgi:hypothetical protein